IFSYLREMVKVNASDLFLTVGCPPSMRVGSKIIAMGMPAFEHDDILTLVDDMLTEDQTDEFSSTLELNLALALEEGQRFRISLFRQKGETGMVIRLIKSYIPSFEELTLPPIYADFIMAKRGLVL